jgi:uncharacterized membrane protein
VGRDAERLRSDRMAATFESIKHRSPLSLPFPAGRADVAPVSRLFTWSMRLLCCAALGVTGYLAVKALRSEDVAGCGGGAVWDCGFALHSRWAKVFALPVSVPAFALYAVVLTSLTFCRPTAQSLRLAWGIVTVGGLSAGLAAVWFIGLQVLAVGHLCVYCLAAHICGLALCLGILWKRPLGARTTARLCGFSALAVGMLIAAQVLSAPPPTFKIEYHPTEVATSPATASPASEAKSKASEVFEPPSGVPNDVDEK